MACDIGAVCHIDVEVKNTVVLIGDRAQSAVNARTPDARGLAELKECRARAELIRAQPVRLDDLVQDRCLRVEATPLNDAGDDDRDRE